MKSIRIYITSIIVLLYFSSCMPQTAEKGKEASGGFGGMTSFIFPVLILLVFWMFFIRPQAKRAKSQKKFIEDLGKGEKIVTIAGIHGTINKVNDDGTLSIEVSPGSYLKIEKSAISMDWTAAINKPVAVTGDKK